MQTLSNPNLQQQLDGLGAARVPSLGVLDGGPHLRERDHPPLQRAPVGVENAAVFEGGVRFVAGVKGVLGNAHGVKRPNM